MSLTPSGVWGTGAWGVNPTNTTVGVWGGANGAGAMYIVSAVATSERTVVVTLSQNAAAGSSLGGGDALNPATWAVTERDSAGDAVRAFIVLAVRQIAGNVFELYTLELFARYPIVHRAEAPTLLAADGSLIAAPTSADFLGCVASVPATSQGMVDLRNVPTGDSTALGGVYEVGASGDYVNHGGVELVRKLVIRRLTTDPSAFFHLTDYGLGIAVKEPFVMPDLTLFKAEIERQVRQEPEIEAAAARVSLDRRGILKIEIRARAGGLEDTIELRVPTGLVEL